VTGTKFDSFPSNTGKGRPSVLEKKEKRKKHMSSEQNLREYHIEDG